MLFHAQQLRGLEADSLHVYARHTPGETFRVVGLPETAAREVFARVGSALAHLGRELPAASIHVAPSNEARGTSVDLAVACAAAGVFAGQTMLVGELALDGKLRPVRGVYAHVRAAALAGHPDIIVPEANAAEAALVCGITVYAAPALDAVLAHLSGVARLAPVATVAPVADVSPTMPAHPASATLGGLMLEGKRRILVVGPVGSGATTLARHIVDQLPPLSRDEMLDVTAVHSVAGLVGDGRGYVARRPFRAPHHTVSEAGLVGGGTAPRPGEVSLAHGGVLYLDDVQEFRKDALAALWSALNRGEATLSARGHVATFPAAPAVVIASAPACACGLCGSARDCRCTSATLQRHRDALKALASMFEATVYLPSLHVVQAASM